MKRAPGIGPRTLLEKSGHEVVGEASDGHEASKLVQSLQPGIGVLDLAMPLLNGLDAIRERIHALCWASSFSKRWSGHSQITATSTYSPHAIHGCTKASGIAAT